MMILVIFAPFVYNITLSKTGKERKTLWILFYRWKIKKSQMKIF